MAMFIFAKAILEGRPIKLFNHGKMRRDFTYVDDVSQAIVRLLIVRLKAIRDWARAGPTRRPAPRPGKFTISATSHPEELIACDIASGKGIRPDGGKGYAADAARRRRGRLMPMSAISSATSASGPQTPIEDGIAGFVEMVS